MLVQLNKCVVVCGSDLQRTLPCGTPFLNWSCVDVWCVDVLFLNVVYALRPLM